jgi:hypothetical protein
VIEDDEAAMAIDPSPPGVVLRPFTEEEVAAMDKQPAEETVTVDEWYDALIALIDERMGEGGSNQERTKELQALAAACVAFEQIMYVEGEMDAPKSAEGGAK